MDLTFLVLLFLEPCWSKYGYLVNNSYSVAFPICCSNIPTLFLFIYLFLFLFEGIFQLNLAGWLNSSLTYFLSFRYDLLSRIQNEKAAFCDFAVQEFNDLQWEGDLYFVFRGKVKVVLEFFRAREICLIDLLFGE